MGILLFQWNDSLKNAHFVLFMKLSSILHLAFSTHTIQRLSFYPNILYMLYYLTVCFLCHIGFLSRFYLFITFKVVFQWVAHLIIYSYMSTCEVKTTCCLLKGTTDVLCVICVFMNNCQPWEWVSVNTGQNKMTQTRSDLDGRGVEREAWCY